MLNHRSSRKKWSLVVLVTAIAAAVSLPATDASAAKKPDLSGVTLNIPWSIPNFQVAFDASGALNDAPYKVNFSTVPVATCLAQLGAGAVDMCGGQGDTNLILAQGNASPPWTKSNVPLVNVSVGKYTTLDPPPSALVVHKDSGINSLADLKGKKISFNPGGWQNSVVLLALSKAHLKTSDVTPVNLDISSGLNAFLTKQVDAYAASIISLDQALNDNAKILLSSPDAGMLTLLTNVSTPSVLKDKTKAAAIGDFLNRYARMLDWVSTHPARLIQLSEDKLGQNPTAANNSVQSMLFHLVPFTKDALSAEQAQADAFHDGGAIPQKINVKLEYDTRFEKGYLGATQGGAASTPPSTSATK
jgi:sulfonate transport system substrate-binding protein